MATLDQATIRPAGLGRMVRVDPGTTTVDGSATTVTATIQPPAIQPLQTTTANPFLRCPLPPIYSSPDSLRQFPNSSVPQQRLFPVSGPKGQLNNTVIAGQSGQFAFYSANGQQVSGNSNLNDANGVLTYTGTGGMTVGQNFKVNGSGVLSRYGGNTLVGHGIPTTVGSYTNAPQTSSIALTSLVPAGVAVAAGLYRVSYYLIITTAAGTSSTCPSVEVVWTDRDNTNSQSFTQAAGNPTSNNLATYIQGSVIINVSTATQILIGTFGYASTGTPVMAYILRALCEYIQP